MKKSGSYFYIFKSPDTIIQLSADTLSHCHPLTT